MTSPRYFAELHSLLRLSSRDWSHLNDKILSLALFPTKQNAFRKHLPALATFLPQILPLVSHMSSEICQFCRCPNTSEHQQEGYHLFNLKLRSENKMPISRDSYEKFEKHRHEGCEQESLAQDNHQNHNVKSWHFSQIDLSQPWFLPTLMTKMQERCNYPHPQSPESMIRVRCVSMDGEATIRTRKAKVVAVFLTDLVLEARCRIDNETVVTAKQIKICDYSSDELDEVNMAAIKLENDGKEYQAEFVKVIKKNCVQDLIKIMQEILKDMQKWVKDPQADVINVPQPLVDWDMPRIVGEKNDNGDDNEQNE